MNEKEWAEKKCQSVNNEPGDLNEYDGYDCPTCHNKGYVFSLVENKGQYDEVSRECKCMPIRRSIRRMKKSGLEGSISRCTFELYDTPEEFQKLIKAKAHTFVDNVDSSVDKWFFIGGAVGCGKTHICTAIVRELLLKGKEAVYMLWVDESTRLKAAVNDNELYSKIIDPIKMSEVLYIDDFLKIVKGQTGDEIKPTAADLKLAYEILNYRYQNPNLITIISSERFVSEIEEIDSAIGSRIYEKTRHNACNVARNKDRNYRTKDMKMI